MGLHNFSDSNRCIWAVKSDQQIMKHFRTINSNHSLAIHEFTTNAVARNLTSKQTFISDCIDHTTASAIDWNVAWLVHDFTTELHDNRIASFETSTVISTRIIMRIWLFRFQGSGQTWVSISGLLNISQTIFQFMCVNDGLSSTSRPLFQNVIIGKD
jgi:hypothetical protein